ncbi:MAG: hypothetical protein IPO21_19610 [Bacteroidales bacterium]|nr:hypothetical protein [Bacteroidales bacterium]
MKTALSVIGSVGLTSVGLAQSASAGYVRGDFHQHTTYSDGSYSFQHVMEKNNSYGLDWWANSEHGGGFPRDAASSGLDLGVTNYWDAITQTQLLVLKSKRWSSGYVALAVVERLFFLLKYKLQELCIQTKLFCKVWSGMLWS